MQNKRKFWPSGVWGNPSKADPEKGKNLLRLASNELIKLVERIEHFEE